MLVMLTGAFGNLGMATAEALVRAGHDVRALDLDTKLSRARAAELQRTAARAGINLDVRFGDIRDATYVRHAVLACDAVIHHAAILPPTTEHSPELARAINVGGTECVLRALEELRTPGRLIFPSSVSVHGPRLHERPPVTAATPTRGTDEYTRGKIACEEMIRASRVPWVITRVGVSPDPGASSVTLDTLRMLFRISPKNRIEYVHRDDVARAMAAAVTCDQALGKTLMLGGGKGCRITHYDLIQTLFDALGLGRVPFDAFGDESYYTDWMDTDEAQRLLNFQSGRFEDYQAELAARMRPIRLGLRPGRRALRWGFLSLVRPR
ncbi:MAG: NAD(P)-dependent oxidoreductase [Sandaracinaceae bacterium]|nr:NAD(P)-dependent oxidoreductase [Sandaracinaceae bacterium]